MTLKETLVSAFRTPRGRHSAAKADDEQVPAPAGLDPGAFQVLAHTLIADLFAAGLRVQNLAARAPSDVQQELEEVADQVDAMIRSIRSFAFAHRPDGTG